MGLEIILVNGANVFEHFYSNWVCEVIFVEDSAKWNNLSPRSKLNAENVSLRK